MVGTLFFIYDYDAQRWRFFYFLTDALGSVRDICRGSDGAVLQSYNYTENGEKTTVNGSGPQSQKTWVGGHSVQDETDDTDLYMMGHRWYSASAGGRFISRDPIGFAGGLNLYSYGNSPVSTIDPLGLWDWSKFNIGLGSLLNKLGEGLEYVGYAEIGMGIGAMANGPAAGPGVLYMEGAGALTAANGAATLVQAKILQGIGKQLLASTSDCPDDLVDLWAPGAPPNDTPLANFRDHAKRKGPDFGIDPDDFMGFGTKAKELLETLKLKLRPITNFNSRNPGGRKSARNSVGEYIQTTRDNLIITIGKRKS